MTALFAAVAIGKDGHITRAFSHPELPEVTRHIRRHGLAPALSVRVVDGAVLSATAMSAHARKALEAWVLEHLHDEPTVAPVSAPAPTLPQLEAPSHGEGLAAARERAERESADRGAARKARRGAERAAGGAAPPRAVQTTEVLQEQPAPAAPLAVAVTRTEIELPPAVDETSVQADRAAAASVEEPAPTVDDALVPVAEVVHPAPEAAAVQPSDIVKEVAALDPKAQQLAPRQQRADELLDVIAAVSRLQPEDRATVRLWCLRLAQLPCP